MMWRKMNGFSMYEVSEFGHIRSLDRTLKPLIDKMGRSIPERRKKGVILKMRKHKFGYLMVTLVRDSGNVFGMTAHRAVALAFKGDPPFENAVARHLDGDCSNNHFSNIEWGSQLDNIQDAMQHGTIQKGEGRYNAKLRESDIVEIRERVMSGEKFAEVGRDFGLSECACFQIASGKKWASAGGPVYKPKRQNVLGGVDVEVIRRRIRSGELITHLSKEYKVSINQIRAIRDGKK